MPNGNVTKIVIDTDPGIDDAMAIHQAFADPRLNVLGLTTIFGNVPTSIATRNAQRLVEMTGQSVPVAAGAIKPLVRPPAPAADFVHGKEGFGNVKPEKPAGNPDNRHASKLINEIVNEHPGEVIICALGPLTNLALALKENDELASKVKSVIVMGGAVACSGNVSEYAEANIWGDPDAAGAVFSAAWDVTMVGLDVTERVRCTPEDFVSIAAHSPRIGGFLSQAADFYFDFHVPKTKERCCFMHDPSAIFAVTDRELFEFENMPLDVVTKGKEMGRTKRSSDLTKRTVRVAIEVQARSLRDKFIEILGNADQIASKNWRSIDDRRKS